MRSCNNDNQFFNLARQVNENTLDIKRVNRVRKILRLENAFVTNDNPHPVGTIRIPTECNLVKIIGRVNNYSSLDSDSMVNTTTLGDFEFNPNEGSISRNNTYTPPYVITLGGDVFWIHYDGIERILTLLSGQSNTTGAYSSAWVEVQFLD